MLIAGSYLAQHLLSIPNFCNIHIIGHQLVNADCSRFNPIKAVNQSQNGLTKCANNKLINKKVPAIPLNILSILITPMC